MLPISARINLPAVLHAAAQRERNLRFLSLWNPFFPFPLPQREGNSLATTRRCSPTDAS
jgi:hypothetical protein